MQRRNIISARYYIQPVLALGQRAGGLRNCSASGSRRANPSFITTFILLAPGLCIKLSAFWSFRPARIALAFRQPAAADAGYSFVRFDAGMSKSATLVQWLAGYLWRSRLF